VSKKAIAYCFGIDVEKEEIIGCDFFNEDHHENPLAIARGMANIYKNDIKDCTFVIGCNKSAAELDVRMTLGVEDE